MEGKFLKKNIKYLIFLLWIIIIYILKINNVISFDLDVIKQYLQINAEYAMLIFSLIWILRIFMFIPGVTLIILGGLCFGPVEGVLLSMLGMIFSETIIFIISRTFIGSKLKNLINKKYPNLSPLVEEYNYKLLGIGIICPIAPTDAVCFLLSSSGINYVKYIMVVIISNVPAILLYSFLGLSFTSSFLGIVLVAVSIVLITIITTMIWYNIKRRLSVGSEIIVSK